MVIEFLLEISQKIPGNKGTLGFDILPEASGGVDSSSFLAALMSNGTVMAIVIGVLVFMLALYIYSSLALMRIAQRTKTEPAWLAWVPIINMYLLVKVARVPMWTLALVLLGIIPFIGAALTSALTIYWFWHVSERCGKPGWFGILMIVPFVNLVILGMLAWKK